MQNKAIFLDRDGTLNYDPGYISDPEVIKLLPGVVEGLKYLQVELHFKLIVVSNQAGISRGLLTHEQVDKVNERISDLLISDQIRIEKFYYCPSHPEFSTEDECKCRKPSPKMILDAADELNIDLSKSYLIGDRASDIESGLNAGVYSILLASDILKEQISILQNHQKSANFVADDFKNAVSKIAERTKKEI
ncbi:MAG: HAD family hydrolase [Melioribacteraceae bacterium]|nr:HAD family hydrolase [Melioribacteraceae bacterium]